jgi:Bacteriophage replication protein O
MATDNQVTFQGFQFPTTTPVPDEVFDVLMPQLSGAELKVLLYICRRTFGFKKDSDSISLSQIAHGIITRAGRVLDGGTGLSKRHVINALKVLEKKNIITVTRTVDEAGLNGVNTYSLNIRASENGVGTKSPQGVVNSSSPGGSEKMLPRVVNPSSPTTNRKQETVRQETDDVVVAVSQELEQFGIAKSAVTTLIQHYPAAYIREKLEMAQRLVASGSALLSQNPAGWLRKAIEEDYSPPRTYRRSRHKTREVKDRKTAHAEPRAASEEARLPDAAGEHHTPKEEPQSAPNVPAEPIPNAATHNSENETTWRKTLEKLHQALPGGEAAARLTGTTLIEVTDTAARIGVRNPLAIPWLERRLYGQIAKAIKGVVGKDLDLQFIAAS